MAIVLLAAMAAVGLPSLRGAEASPLVVGVRSNVQVRAGQGQVYFIRSVQQISAMEKIKPPLDVDALLGLVRKNLSAAGFRPIAPGLRPDVAITVEYGRDWLENPYLGGSPNVTGTSSAVPADGSGIGLAHTPQQNITGTTVQLMNQIGNGMEARLQKAQYEKLYLKVIAWQYQADPKARMKRLWMTTMAVDDPEMDLNAVASTMLAAGGPYFGQPLKEAELEVSQPMPVAHVVVGRPQVVDAPSPAPAPVASAEKSAGPAPAPPAARKNFDLPAADAAATLQEFARQSGEEIIFPVDQVRPVKLPGVHGELTTHDALTQLLEGSGLVAIQDEKTGAWVVRPAAQR